MGKACSRHGEEECKVKPDGKRPLENLQVEERII
jgi:hypothetical protein